MSEAVNYPPPTPSTEASLLSPTFSPQSGPAGSNPAAVSSSLKKRKSSKSKAPLEIRRATSTPHLRGVAMAEGPMSPTSADKRRNKLGYHRTSVACGHCRRRKIRCLLPSPEDAQGRCANCIRLKKECVFYPVTEAGQHERNVKKPSIAGTPSEAETSPRAAAPSNQSSIDDTQSKGSYQQPVRQLQSATPADGFAVSHPNGAPFFSQPYPYQPHQGTETWSPSSFTSPNTQQAHQPQEPASPYWTSTSIPSSSSYQTSPSAAMGPPQSVTSENPNFAYVQGGQNWAPSRSLSLSHIEQAPPGHPQHYPLQDRAHEAQHQHHPSHLPYPSPVSTQGQLRTVTNDQYSLSSQARASYPYPTQPWQGYPPAQQYSHEANPEYASQWYAEPTSAVRSEEHPAPGVAYGQPTAYYSNASHPG